MRICLLLAVAAIFPVMVGLGIEAFMPGPDVDYSECYSRPVTVDGSVSKEEQDRLYEEDAVRQKACTERIDSLKQPHEAKVFAITSIVGLLAVAVGALKFVELTGPAGPGLVLGGIFTIMYGTARTFSTVDKRWLFVVALGTLIGVVWVSRKWFIGSGETKKRG